MTSSDSRRSPVRALKVNPEHLRDDGDVILGAIGDVQSGDLEPIRANAMANLARALVAAQEYGAIERRIADLEVALKEQAS